MVCFGIKLIFSNLNSIAIAYLTPIITTAFYFFSKRTFPIYFVYFLLLTDFVVLA